MFPNCLYWSWKASTNTATVCHKNLLWNRKTIYFRKGEHLATQDFDDITGSTSNWFSKVHESFRLEYMHACEFAERANETNIHLYMNLDLDNAREPIWMGTRGQTGHLLAIMGVVVNDGRVVILGGWVLWGRRLVCEGNFLSLRMHFVPWGNWLHPDDEVWGLGEVWEQLLEMNCVFWAAFWRRNDGKTKERGRRGTENAEKQKEEEESLLAEKKEEIVDEQFEDDPNDDVDMLMNNEGPNEDDDYDIVDRWKWTTWTWRSKKGYWQIKFGWRWPIEWRIWLW